MKYIFITLLIFVSVNCISQKQKEDTIDLGYHGRLTDSSTKTPGILTISGTLSSDFYAITDTVKIIMLVCDTSHNNYTAMTSRVWWMRGYVIMKTFKRDGGWIFNYTPTDSINGYLDEQKQPLPKGFVVWITKELSN